MANKNDLDRSKIPLAYLITFTCYGHRLHGDQQGSVNPEHNSFDTPFLPEHQQIKKIKKERMNHAPYQLDQERRNVVQRTLQEVCEHRGWCLIASHVRSTHAHAVVHACREPERVMGDVKSYASRRLNEAGFGSSDRKRWTRHGSNKYLFAVDALQNAIRYALYRQGEPMAVFLHERLDEDEFREYDAGTNRLLRSFLQNQQIIDEKGELIIHDQ